MNGDDTPRSDFETKANAVATVLEKVPLYQDALQPAAKQVGDALGATLGFVNLILRPIQTFTMAGSSVMDRVDQAVREVLVDHPESRIVEPKAYIASNAFIGMASSLDEKPLRDMYAKLLAAASLQEMQSAVHPSYADVIRQMTPREAEIFPRLKQKAPAVRVDLHGDDGYITIAYGFDWPNTESVSTMEVENLQRLGLVEVSFDRRIAGDGFYRELLEKFVDYKERESEVISSSGRSPKLRFGMVKMTEFGVRFHNVCASTEEWSW